MNTDGEDLLRELAPQITAVLVRRSGVLAAAAEDAVHEVPPMVAGELALTYRCRWRRR